jgi:hypothetical protein
MGRRYRLFQPSVKSQMDTKFTTTTLWLRFWLLTIVAVCNLVNAEAQKTGCKFNCLKIPGHTELATSDSGLCTAPPSQHHKAASTRPRTA